MRQFPSTQDTTKTLDEQIKDEMDDLDAIDERIDRWEARFEVTDSGTYNNLVCIERLDRLEADRRETKANIKRLRALRDAQ